MIPLAQDAGLQRPNALARSAMCLGCIAFGCKGLVGPPAPWQGSFQAERTGVVSTADISGAIRH